MKTYSIAIQDWALSLPGESILGLYDYQSRFLEVINRVVDTHGGRVYRDPVHGTFGSIYLADLNDLGVAALRAESDLFEIESLDTRRA